MANLEHLELLKQGVDVWNQWRERHPEIVPDLRDIYLSEAYLSAPCLKEANFSGVKLSGASLHEFDLRGVNLSEADLSSAKLRGVDLRDMDLRGVNLRKTDLSSADLRGANLSDVYLCGAKLRGAKLREANLSGAQLRGAKFRGADLVGANLSNAALCSTSLSGADLRKADLHKANLTNAKLSGANLSRAQLTGAKLSGLDLREVYLQEADLSEAKLRKVKLSGTSLREVRFCRADLSGANLSDAYLRGADLSSTNLNNAKLIQTQALGTNFNKAVFTGVCLENWNINSATRFDDAICDYVYLKANQQERRPREGTFKPGEFAALFQQAVDTVDLIFKDGIDWQAFFQSFQELRSQYIDNNLSIQAIERKQGGAFVIRVEVSEGADKSAIESSAKELYEIQLKTLEAQYEKQLRFQGEQHSEEIQRLIAAERQEKATLMGVLTTMASQQGPKYDMRGAQIAGGVADKVQGGQVGGTINIPTSKMPSITEAAAEIQDLLKQLGASNPNATEAEKMAYLSAIIPPTCRERFIGALKSASGAEIKEMPYGLVLKALVEGWQNPNG